MNRNDSDFGTRAVTSTKVGGTPSYWRNSLEETLSSLTPLEKLAEPEQENVTPQPAAKSEKSRLKKKLSALRAPFKQGSPFHIGSSKKSGKSDGNRTDSSQNTSPALERKKGKKQKSSSTASLEGGATKEKREGRAGALVRRLGSFRRSRRDTDSPATSPNASLSPSPTPSPVPPRAVNADVGGGSQSGSARDMEDASSDIPSQTSSQELSLPASTPLAPEPPVEIDPAAVAADHPVSTLPFAKSTWQRHRSHEIARPVEEPSPESTLKRRIAFVSQASTCLLDEQDGAPSNGAAPPALQRMVELARASLTRAPSASPEADEIDAEEERTESCDEFTEARDTPATAPSATATSAMPAHGDLIADEPRSPMGANKTSHAAPAGSERREHLYKILVIGELGAGKTSIIKRYVHQFFSQHYRATIGVDFALKVLNWDSNTIIRLQLWDIAGQERFGNMTRVYYKEAVGAFVVFDVTRAATFDAVHKWKADLDAKVQLPDGSPIPCILLANKCDQQKEGIVNTPAKMEEYCKEKGFAAWFETSAKENINIEEAARALVNKILLNDKLLQSNDSKDDRFALGQDHKLPNGQDSGGDVGKSCAC